jgi:hypothetical protein
MSRIAAHATGHDSAREGALLRVGCEHGLGLIATRHDPSLHVIQQVRGLDEGVEVQLE